MTDKKQLKPLTITCTDVDCDHNMHCFIPTRAMVEEGNAGHCRGCDADLVDWDRVHRRDPKDIDYTIAAMRREYFREHMWTVQIDQLAVNYARRKGILGLKEAAEKRIRKYVLPCASDIFRDGTQTPRQHNPIYYAQHGTATCCRKCAEYWHGIPKIQELSDQDVDYFVELLMAYIEQRLPGLTDAGEYVPPVRR